MTQVVLSIGANLGDAETMVYQTIHQLSEILKESKASRIYQTAPVGVEDQPEFFNAVVWESGVVRPMNFLKELRSLKRLLVGNANCVGVLEPLTSTSSPSETK